MKMYGVLVVVVVVAIAIATLTTENAIHASLVVRNYTPVTTNATNTSEATITTVTVTSYTTTTITSYIFQTYTSIQVVTLNWGVDPNLTITFIVVAGVVALSIGYLLGYKAKREEVVSKLKVEKPAAKPQRR
ncbi:MAG: hypothetical protein N3D82_05805 [Ignisphaera sp.]|nr:hypothetical protein [Ignisphaera sp.]MCX8168519.1 hypothetical protein [Ignisphaera sp.]MDW8085042.1 hypothetical protein [Ignisphaera sp.]